MTHLIKSSTKSAFLLMIMTLFSCGSEDIIFDKECELSLVVQETLVENIEGIWIRKIIGEFIQQPNVATKEMIETHCYLIIDDNGNFFDNRITLLTDKVEGNHDTIGYIYRYFTYFFDNNKFELELKQIVKGISTNENNVIPDTIQYTNVYPYINNKFLFDQDSLRYSYNTFSQAGKLSSHEEVFVKM